MIEKRDQTHTKKGLQVSQFTAISYKDPDITTVNIRCIIIALDTKVN